MLLRLRKGILALAMGPDYSAFVDRRLDYKTAVPCPFAAVGLDALIWKSDSWFGFIECILRQQEVPGGDDSVTMIGKEEKGPCG